MAKYVLKDVSVSVAGTLLSDHASSVTIEDSADKVDFTAMGPAGYKAYGQGFKDATITCTFFSDFAAGSVHQTLQPLYGSGGTFTVKLVPVSAVAIGTTNPSATMTATLYGYSGIGGNIGDAASFDAVFSNAGTAGLVWGTT